MNRQAQCALRGADTMAVCGGTPALISDASGTTGWEALVLGDQHGCGIRDGALFCFGSNTDGELGDGTKVTTSALRPEQTNQLNWKRVAPGARHSCAVRAGEMWCWGDGAQGQLGLDNGTIPHVDPTQVGTDTDWTDAQPSATLRNLAKHVNPAS